jgi:hypothetical protein
VIAKGLFVVEAGFRRLPVGEFWHPLIGAVGFATVGLVVPGALGVGYAEIGDVLNGRLAIGAVAALLAAKLLAWWLALGSGTSGGTLAPILLIAGCFGTLFGTAAADVLPAAQPSVSAFALVAMAATFGAATRTPFTSIVFLFELTQDYQAVLPFMGTTVLAVIVAQALTRESLMTEKLARRGLSVHNFPRGSVDAPQDQDHISVRPHRPRPGAALNPTRGQRSVRSSDDRAQPTRGDGEVDVLDGVELTAPRSRREGPLVCGRQAARARLNRDRPRYHRRLNIVQNPSAAQDGTDPGKGVAR